MKSKKKKFIEYDKKDFLVKNSLYSCSSYHAAVTNELYAVFRVHDCNNGIKLVNNINESKQVEEMMIKLRTLGNAALDFANFIEENYYEKRI